MQGFRHSQRLSRRKLHFEESKLDQCTNKRLCMTGSFLPQGSLRTRQGSSHELLSSKIQQKDETDVHKAAATYRRRHLKPVQERRDEHDKMRNLECKSVPDGFPGELKGLKTQSGFVADRSRANECELRLVSMQKEADKASSRRSSKAANVTDYVEKVQANQSSSDEERSVPDPNAAVKTTNFEQGDMGQQMQGFAIMNVVPIAQYTSSLDVIPLNEGLLSHAVDTAIVYEGPYPSFSRPSQEECSKVCERLSQLHGPLHDYAKHKAARTNERQVLALEYREEKDLDVSKYVVQQEVLPSGHPRDRHTVLDSLVGTILSQNTTDANSQRAFASLKAKFPTWEAVYAADPKAVEDAIRCGGLAEIKTSRILNILKILDQERGKLCLEYVRSLSVDEIKLELSRFKGVGPKTVACVLMFHLQQNEFPVDTHVFRITKLLGWVPAKADREKAYMHLNHRIPNHLKFDLHCLLVTHGKRCPRCSKGGRTQKPADGPCPLVNLKSIEASSSDLLLES